MSRRDQPPARRSRRSSRRSPIRASSTSIAATGEQVTIGLLAIALQDDRASRRAATPAAQVRVLTDNAYTKARILEIDEDDMRARSRGRRRRRSSPASRASTPTATSRRSGRGGSDTSGVALAAALKADECQIYTDVDGVYTTDPRIVPEARRLDTITFEEMLEMASLGLEGAADPLGRVRRQVQGQAARAVVVRGSRGDGDRARSSRSRKTRTWNRRSSPASRSTATKPRSR